MKVHVVVVMAAVMQTDFGMLIAVLAGEDIMEGAEFEACLPVTVGKMTLITTINAHQCGRAIVGF